jgi:type VI secretion system protein ImpK
MDRITDVTRECFIALAQLRQVEESNLPSPEALGERLRRFVDALFQRAQQAGYGREEANDIAYPIVALADEIVLSKSEALRQAWADRSLQLHYFHENVAGEGFFTRLEGIRRDARRQDILRVYYLALLLGFHGRYRVRGGDLELMALCEDLARELARRSSEDDELSPSGERPREAAARRAGRSPVLYAGLGLLALALLGYAGMRVSASAQVDHVVKRIGAANLP